jgi:hypothetical protein
MEPSRGDVIVVWFSCGAASAIAAQETLRQYGEHCTVRVVNNPIQEEDEDNQRFLHDVARWLGVRIEQATSSKYPNQSCEEVWEHRRYMAGNTGAPCTIELKKVARQEWEQRNDVDWHVLGFTTEEATRHKRFTMTERDNVLPVLIDAGVTKADCYNRLFEAGIQVPRVYMQGYPNANCVGCVKATSATYWNHVRQVHPEVFERRAEQSRRLGAKLARCHPQYLPWCERDKHGEWWDTREGKCLHSTDAKGYRRLNSPRVFLDELPEDAKGAPMKGMDVECGIFCEEKD